MHENFIALNQEKRDRIMNAAMHEFATKGFKDASTNEIIKKAGISKGALFHYFSSKKDLFEFLYRYSVHFFIDATKPHIKDLPSDVFERWIAFAALKLRIAAQYPDLAAFMQGAYRDNAQESGNLLKKEVDAFSASFQKLIYEGIDTSKFRTDLALDKALQIIWWVLEGYALNRLKDPFHLPSLDDAAYLQALINDMEDYLTLLKRSLYKEEFWD